MDEIVAVGYPVLMALSNKDFIGETLDAGVDDRAEGTLAATGTPVHRGRSQQLWRVEIEDDRGRTAAVGQVRLANLQ